MTDSRDEYRKEWSAEMRAAAAEDDAASSEKWNQGCDFAMTQLCTLLGVDPRMVNWDAATETVDGDVQAVIGNIFLVKFGEDWADRLCASLAAPRPAAPLGGREAIARLIRKAFVENWRDDCDGRQWDEDVLLTGCRKVGGGMGYHKPEEAAQRLAMDAVDAILAAVQQRAPLGGREIALHFNDGSITPDVKPGHYDGFIIVTENDKGGKHAFAAYYLNGFPLDHGDECICDSAYDHDDGCPTTGWFYDQSNFEYDNCYFPISAKVIRWVKIPSADAILAAIPQAIESECCREDTAAWEPCPPFAELQDENGLLRAALAVPVTVDEIEQMIAIEFGHSKITRHAAERVFNFLSARCDVRILKALKASPTPQERGAVADIVAERDRQISQEGWSREHDDAHIEREMAIAAACYASAPSMTRIEREWVKPDMPKEWPWKHSWWKPGTMRKNLIKAGALIVAEIERLDRAALQKDKP